MLAHFRFVRKEDAELTDLQKRLDIFLEGENARLEEELEAAQAGKDRKRYYDILLQMIEIMGMREKTGIDRVENLRRWWHT